jgi:hypothetical protein
MNVRVKSWKDATDISVRNGESPYEVYGINGRGLKEIFESFARI